MTQNASTRHWATGRCYHTRLPCSARSTVIRHRSCILSCKPRQTNSPAVMPCWCWPTLRDPGASPSGRRKRSSPGLPARLQPVEPHFVWFGFGRAVAALGFGGLSGAVETAIARGLIPPDLMQSAEFWENLRDSQQHPNDVDGPVWSGLGPMGRRRRTHRDGLRPGGRRRTGDPGAAQFATRCATWDGTILAPAEAVRSSRNAAWASPRLAA